MSALDLLYALPCLPVSDFWFYDYYTIHIHILLSTCILSCLSPALSDHTMSLPYLISIAVYLLVPVCLYLRHGLHVYDPDLSIHMCLSMLAIWLLHHHSPGSSDSSGSSCPGFGAWSVWILPVDDQSSAAVAWISSRSSRAPSFQAPLFGSRVFLL